MALLTAPASAAFDSLSALEGSLVSVTTDAITIAFSAIGSKDQATLKLNGRFDAQGNILALSSGACILPGGSMVSIAFPDGITPVTLVTAPTLRVDRLLDALFDGDDWFKMGDQADRIRAGGGDDIVDAGGGHDRIHGGAGNDVVTGGAGLDTAVYDGQRSRYTISSDTSGFSVADQSGTEGTDRLDGVERLHFGDVRVALDMDGHAGQVAKLLGAVFGAKAVSNRDFFGIGLSLSDGGMGYEALAALAVGAAGASTPAAVVNLLWTNVVGQAPTAAQAQPFLDMLSAGTSIGALAVMAADTSLNTGNIDLVGLAKTGAEYIEPPA